MRPDSELFAREIADALWLALRRRRGRAVGGPAEHGGAAAEPAPTDAAAGPHRRGERSEPGPAAWRLVDWDVDGDGTDPDGDEPRPEPDPVGPGRGGAHRPRRVGRVTVGRRVFRALRPLKQVTWSDRDQEFDEDATATRAAGDQRWLPVYRPVRELRWDVVVVVDDSASVGFWAHDVDNLVATLTRLGAFRDVRVRRLGPGPDGVPALRGTGRGAPRRHVAELVDAARRRVVLVVTDGVADMWRDGTASAVLRLWGTAHPVALVHLLPWSVANRMGLEIHRLLIRSSAPGAANSRLEWTPQAEAPGVFDGLDDAMPVCVLELGSAALDRWSRMTAGAPGPMALGAVLVPARPDRTEGPPAERASAARLVADFQAAASPTAFTLAVHLAASPLDPDLMSLIRTSVSTAELEHQAELLASPLVVPVTAGSPVGAGGVVYDFVAGVRSELLAHGRRATTARVRRYVHAHLGERIPDLLGYTARAARGEVRTEDVSPATAHFFEAELAVLQALSGAHQPQAHRLGALLGRTPEGLPAGPGHRHAVPAGPAERERVPLVVDVPGRNPAFTSRDDLLADLRTRLAPGGGTTATVVLHGTGGVGKSHVAIEYAHRHERDHDVICWIPASRRVQIVNALLKLGRRLGISLSDGARGAVQPVLDALRGVGPHRVPGNWLLIFDNATGAEDLEPYLPRGTSGSVLITSRHAGWGDTAHVVDVGVFRRRESTALLRQHDATLPEGDADRLADALGDLPLALMQAATWRRSTGTSADKYLRLLDQRRSELADLAPHREYPLSVAAAWTLSLEQLRRDNLPALRLLQVCAFLAPQPVPRALFARGGHIAAPPELQGLLRDRMRLSEAFREVGRYGLARFDRSTFSLDVHRLVQAALISRMDERERTEIRHVAHLVIAAGDPGEPEDLEHWPLYVELNAHLFASGATECDDGSVRAFHRNQVTFLHRWGEPEQSAELAEVLYRGWSARLGPEHPDTLWMGLWLGFVWWVLGRFGEASRLNATLLELCHRTGGEAHEMTIQAVNAVAGDRRAGGDFAGALRLDRRNHRICRDSSDVDEAITLNAAHNLGVSLRLAGEFRAAYALDADTWRQKIETFDRQHVLALMTEVGLAIDRREAGDYLGARSSLEAIVATYRRLHGPTNPALLLALRQLAVSRRKAGDHEGALEAVDEALEGFLLRYGPDHPDTLAAKLSRSIDLREVDLPTGARMADDAFESYRRVLGPTHPHTLAAAVNVATVKRLTGDVAGALELDRATASSFRERLGEDHPSSIATAINLASDLHAAGDLWAAYEVGAAALGRAVATLGADHPTTLVCRANLAQDQRVFATAEDAAELRRDALRGLRARLGPRHPVITVLSDPEGRANCDIDPLPL
ncbi:FxSxx-COOH system tetratricopeptide repeat protein [Saccharothrix sp. BKS2]|uniref:FxSxx-COOH system tetratricopeptide repeat protein n=1 Tax=Saccharothrix sp. BKS2 TaxID=3064400 RepID=UPI0039E872D6